MQKTPNTLNRINKQNSFNFWFFIYKYINLARLTKPYPIFLLIFPTFCSLALNSRGYNYDYIDIIYLYLAFLVGGILARSIGAVINDIADRKIDRNVERTKERMLASKRISLIGAITFIILLSIFALAILFTFNLFTIILGIIAAMLTIIYPLAKRVTYYPQVILGISYSFGILMAQSALDECFTLPTILLYIASVFWVIGFDSIYATQDYKDDIKTGVKSIVVAFGKDTQIVVAYLYLFTLIFLVIIGFLINANFIYYVILVLIMFHFVWQVVNIDIENSTMAETLFNYNAYVGLLLWVAFLIG